MKAATQGSKMRKSVLSEKIKIVRIGCDDEDDDCA